MTVLDLTYLFNYVIDYFYYTPLCLGFLTDYQLCPYSTSFASENTIRVFYVTSTLTITKLTITH